MQKRNKSIKLQEFGTSNKQLWEQKEHAKWCGKTHIVDDVQAEQQCDESAQVVIAQHVTVQCDNRHETCAQTHRSKLALRQNQRAAESSGQNKCLRTKKSVGQSARRSQKERRNKH